MLRLVLIGAAIAALPAGSKTASAGLLDTHAFAGTYGPYDPVYDQNGDVLYGLKRTENFGANSVSAGPHSTSVTSSWTSASSAQANSTASGLLKASASSSSSTYAPANATAAAAWRDVAKLNSALSASALRLVFRVEAQLSAELGMVNDIPVYPFSNTWAELGVVTTTTPLGFFEDEGPAATVIGIEGSASFDYEATLYRGNQLQTSSAPGEIGLQPDGSYEEIPRDSHGNSGYLADAYFGDTGWLHASGLPSWDAMSWNGSTFVGDFHIDTPYDAQLGGYGWGVLLSARAFGGGGIASTDAAHTLTLNAVTLADGRPVDVTFDSGLRFNNAVPEPSTLVMSSIWMGTTGMVWLGKRLRRPR
jgi:hypothetical protein